MFEKGDIVKIKPEWRNPGETGHERYIVTYVNEDTKRCYIRDINDTQPLPGTETVGFETLELVAAERLVYAVRFHRKDGQPVEEYEYHNKDDAVNHFEIFRADDSNLYTHVELTETRIGLPEKVLETISFKAVEVNREKLKAYLSEEMIMEFSSPEECLDYFNTYDGQHFQTVEEMKEYQGPYGFGLDGKWYHISFDEALDVIEKASLESVIQTATAKSPEEKSSLPTKNIER